MNFVELSDGEGVPQVQPHDTVLPVLQLQAHGGAAPEPLVVGVLVQPHAPVEPVVPVPQPLVQEIVVNSPVPQLQPVEQFVERPHIQQECVSQELAPQVLTVDMVVPVPLLQVQEIVSPVPCELAHDGVRQVQVPHLQTVVVIGHEDDVFFDAGCSPMNQSCQCCSYRCKMTSYQNPELWSIRTLSTRQSLSS